MSLQLFPDGTDAASAEAVAGKVSVVYFYIREVEFQTPYFVRIECIER